MLNIPAEKNEAVVKALSSTLSLSGALFNCLRALGDDFPAQGVFANSYSSETRKLRILATADRNGHQTKAETIDIPEEVDARRIPHGGDAYALENVFDDPLTGYAAPKIVPVIRSAVMVPVRLEGRHLGVVCFWNSKPAAFSQKHLAELESLATLLALNVGFALAQRLQRHAINLEVKNKELTQTLADVKDAPLKRLIENTPSMKSLEPLIRQAASFDVPVLVTGESGTGKEVVAQTIHRMSKRAMKPFVRVNCSAIPDALIESELFGYEAGAFTDAKRRRIGLFEEADGGTLFLDEIGELPLPMQAKILHAVQDKKIRRVGATTEIPVNVRIISATNRDLPESIALKRFRLDLYYRLNVLDLRILPLRERHEDFPTLLKLFVGEVCENFSVTVPPNFASVLAAQAENHAWPGNVRELKNTVIRSVLAWSQNGGAPVLITDPGVPVHEAGTAAQSHDESDAKQSTETTAAASNGILDVELPNEDASGIPDFETMQKKYFTNVLQACRGRISGPNGAAKIAGMHPNTLRSRLEKLGLL